MIRKCIILAFALTTYLHSMAQSVGEDLKKTDAVESSLVNDISGGAKGEDIVNVDLYTGTANVNIPIYKYSVDGLDLDVSVNYNTKGIKVDEAASSVGLGWNLEADGYIERILYGVEDEVTIPSLIPISNTSSKKVYQQGNWPQEDPAGSACSTCPYSSAFRDAEKDMFIAHFGGRTVKFVLQTNVTQSGSFGHYIYTIPRSEININFVYYNSTAYNPVEVSYIYPLPREIGYNESDKYIGFIITDEKGNEFYFKRGDYERKPFDFTEYNADPLTGIYYATTRWVLEKIITHQKKTIKYNYSTADIKYSQYKSEKVKETEYYVDDITGLAHTPQYSVLENKVEKWYGRVSHISSIEYPNGINVLFDLDNNMTNARCDLQDVTGALSPFVLKSISIQNSSLFDPVNNIHNTIKYKFNYAYFNNPYAGNTNIEIPYGSSCSDIKSTFGVATALADSHMHYGLRLKLKSVEKVGMDNSVEPYYFFDYNNTPLPDRLSPGRDCYGYANGSSTVPLSFGVPNVNHYLQIPNHTFSATNYGVNRSSNFVYAQACVLNKIVNGLGGTIQIAYKDHSLTNIPCSYGTNSYYAMWDPSVSSSLPALGCAVDPDLQYSNVNDGICVDYIDYDDGFSTDHSKHLYYNYSGGERFYRGGYFWYPEVIDDANNHNVLQRIYTNYFVAPQEYFNGSNHGYTNVVVSTKGINNELLSKKSYTFSNLQTHPNDVYHPESYLRQITGLKFHGAPRNSMDQNRMGLLVNVTEYDSNNDPVSITNNEYEYLDVSNNNAYTAYYSKLQNPNTENVLPNVRYIPFVKYTNNASGILYGTTTKVSQMYDIATFNTTRLKKTTTTNYSEYKTFTTEYTYSYDDRDNTKSIEWYNSQGDHMRKEYLYSYEYGSNLNINSCQPTLVQKQFKVGERLMKLVSSTDIKVLTHSVSIPSVFDYTTLGNGNTAWYACKTRFSATYEPTIQTPIALSSADYDESLALTGSGNLLSLQIRKEFSFDNKGNIIETHVFPEDRYVSSIWDTRITEKIAEVTNAEYNNVAYTSFEGLTSAVNITDYDRGNWLFDPVFVIRGTGITGQYSYSIPETANTNIYTKNAPSNGKDYLLSFWAQGTPVVKLGSTILTLTPAHTVGNWTLYVLPFQGDGSSNIIIEKPSSSYLIIDELRLYPSNASMTTFTHEPLLGLSSMCDNQNNIIYIDYDTQGRKWRSRDIEGNILSQTEHKIHSANN